jgi:hypothetical protein
MTFINPHTTFDDTVNKLCRLFPNQLEVLMWLAVLERLQIAIVVVFLVRYVSCVGSSFMQL